MIIVHGDLDLFFSNVLQPTVLMRNDGVLQFTDVSAAAVVADTGVGMGCAWADYNGDTWLDLYVSNRTGADGSATGSNYKSQNDLIVHFGLDDAVVVDEVRVTWPGGATRTLTGLATNQTWIVEPPGDPAVPVVSGAGLGVALLLLAMVGGSVIRLRLKTASRH